MTRLDLDQQRDSMELLGASLSAWWHHLPVFLVLAALVVVPVDLVLRVLGDDVQLVAGPLAGTVVIPSLVTALHVLAVQSLGRGERPSIRGSVAGTGRVALPVLLVVALYACGVLVGLALLVAPGIFLAVHWYFGAQVAVVEGRRGRGALRRSGELVGHRWGRVFALLLLLGIAPGIAGGFVTTLFEVAIDGRPLMQTVVFVAVQCAVLSFTALAATLLFYDLRARSEPF